MATPTYVPIETYTVSGGSTQSVTLGSGGTIPQTYTDLVIVSNVAFNNSDSLSFRFNGDTSSSNLYSFTVLSGNGSSAVSLKNSNTSRGLADYNGFPTSTVGEYVSILQIMNYSNSSTYKTVLSRGNQASHGTDAIVNLYRSTSPITSITLGMGTAQTTNFAAGSTITLYGIANAAIGAPKATGGIITYDNTYYYHTFGASGTFTPQQNLTNVDYLVVAGGGGGGRYYGGGGGAGGLRSTVDVTGGGGTLESKISLTSGTAYTITVGAGGAGGIDGGSGAQAGTNGVDSSIAGSGLTTITSTGGGGGGGAYGGSNNPGLTGGSGGGGNRDASTAGGSGTANQGYAGSTYTSGTGINAGGGGGGAGEAGNTDGNAQGGDGVAIPTIANVTGTGVATYYAGGGGGGAEFVSIGGLGGGGNGGVNSTIASPGVVNTGGGGGGGSQAPSYVGGAGGSGLVVIRYAKA